MSTQDAQPPSKLRKVLVRVGGLAFWFFFLKGMAWIVVFFLGWKTLF